MGFLDALRRNLRADAGAGDPAKLAEAWGFSDTSHPEFADDADVAADPAQLAAPAQPSAYDREQWLRKLKRVLDKLPASQAEWDPMLAEGRALNLGDEWLARVKREEFTLLVRRALADCRFTEEEHRKLDLARQLIGLTESEAEDILKSVIAEVEAFFGRVLGSDA